MISHRASIRLLKRHSVNVSVPASYLVNFPSLTLRSKPWYAEYVSSTSRRAPSCAPNAASSATPNAPSTLPQPVISVPNSSYTPNTPKKAIPAAPIPTPLTCSETGIPKAPCPTLLGYPIPHARVWILRLHFFHRAGLGRLRLRLRVRVRIPR